MNRQKICAIVVTFNRKKLLLECLESLKKQTRPLDAIYIIDNASTDQTTQLLLDKNYITELPPNLNENWEKNSIVKNLTNGNDLKIHYMRIYKNTGGAGGFYEGVKKAYNDGYDWLWLMDDDTEPEENSLKVLCKYFDKNISALASIVKGTDNSIHVHHRGYFNFDKGIPFQKVISKSDYKKDKTEIDMAAFLGLLVSKESINKIGFPKKEFFIHADDLEYCIRLRKVGKILLISNSIITHKEQIKNVSIQKTFLGKKSLRKPYNNFWISYYIIRNMSYIGKKYTKNRKSLYIDILKHYLKNVINIMLFDDHKYKRLVFITNAYLDGLSSNFDNTKPKKILYK